MSGFAEPTVPLALVTERLLLRMPTEYDWRALHAYYGDADSVRYTVGAPLTENCADGEYVRFTGRPLVIVLMAVRRQPPTRPSTIGCRSFPQRRPAPNGSSHTTDVVLLSGWL
jgi:hypothetical protein